MTGQSSGGVWKSKRACVCVCMYVRARKFVWLCFGSLFCNVLCSNLHKWKNIIIIVIIIIIKSTAMFVDCGSLVSFHWQR